MDNEQLGKELEQHEEELSDYMQDEGENERKPEKTASTA